MANEPNRRLMRMHEALDENLDSEALDDLRSRLELDDVDSAAFDRLRRTDRLLRAAPMEPAPENLALKIMARLAENLSPERLRGSSAALAIGLAAVALLLTPLLAVAGWLIISAVSSATILSGLVGQVVLVIGALMSALEALVDGAQDVMTNAPEASLLLLALVPIAVIWLIRFRWDDDWDPGALDERDEAQ
ncbi:MAG: hypothetical protein L6Q98_14520 [Anaerolineae bacterium]|nr:hypothetical protein [Anaerolineae bacterium]NUQ04183.1 hypothetical protein [Anaerolineae bacterium]